VSCFCYTTNHTPFDLGAVGCHKYAEAVHRFMSAGLRLTSTFDFRSQRLVGIGHSLGGVAMLVSHSSIHARSPFTASIPEPYCRILNRPSHFPLSSS
jgi:hypothetical protein